MVFVVDAFGAWLVEQPADAGRTKLTELILGDEQDRALRQAAADAIRATADEISLPDSGRARQVAMVIDHVFSDPLPDTPPSRAGDAAGRAAGRDHRSAGCTRSCQPDRDRPVQVLDVEREHLSRAHGGLVEHSPGASARAARRPRGEQRLNVGAGQRPGAVGTRRPRRRARSARSRPAPPQPDAAPAPAELYALN